MKALLGRALVYRAGSIVLGFTVLLVLTGDAHKSLLWEAIFFITHTTYYMLFHLVERRLRPAEVWIEAVESSGLVEDEVLP